MESTRIAALAACHNRRRKTLSALEALFNQKLPPGVSLRVYLLDAGSTDGTPHAVQNAFPEVELLRGDGSLFWNGGMRLAFSQALTVGYDYYLWLNDDTILEGEALANLLHTHRSLAKEGSPDSI